MREQVRYVRLDIHKEVAVSCIVNEAGKVLDRQRWGCTRDA